jgi:hypothetical protein
MVKKSSICRICGSGVKELFIGTMLSRLQVDYFECAICGYVQTEDPYWLGDAYHRSITASDTGIMIRNHNNSKMVLATMYLLGALDGIVVDCAGGYGILVRMLRDLGINAFWSDRYSENLLASGFEYEGGAAQLVTAFEAFEHFVQPREELAAMLSIAPNVLISTEIAPIPTPSQKDWWYYGPEHGQHIGFFRVETLRQLAASHGKRLLTDGRAYHLFTDQPLSLWKWRFTRKVIANLPGLLAGRLTPKVWSDHQYISGRSTAT